MTISSTHTPHGPALVGFLAVAVLIALFSGALAVKPSLQYTMNNWQFKRPVEPTEFNLLATRVIAAVICLFAIALAIYAIVKA